MTCMMAERDVQWEAEEEGQEAILQEDYPWPLWHIPRSQPLPTVLPAASSRPMQASLSTVHLLLYIPLHRAMQNYCFYEHPNSHPMSPPGPSHTVTLSKHRQTNLWAFILSHACDIVYGSHHSLCIITSLLTVVPQSQKKRFIAPNPLPREEKSRRHMRGGQGVPCRSIWYGE